MLKTFTFWVFPPLFLGLYHHFSLLCIICSMLLRNFPRISPLISIHGRFIPPFPQLSIGDSSHRNGLNLGCASPDNDATSLFTTHHQPDRGHSVASSRKKKTGFDHSNPSNMVNLNHQELESPSNMVNLNQEMESNHGKKLLHSSGHGWSIPKPWIWVHWQPNLDGSVHVWDIQQSARVLTQSL